MGDLHLPFNYTMQLCADKKSVITGIYVSNIDVIAFKIKLQFLTL